MLDLRSEARRRLLAYYFTNPAARVHLRDLAERLDTDPSNLSKELRRLEQEGLFRSEISGRQKYFRLNRAYPLFAEVRRIVEKNGFKVGDVTTVATEGSAQGIVLTQSPPAGSKIGPDTIFTFQVTE